MIRAERRERVVIVLAVTAVIGIGVGVYLLVRPGPPIQPKVRANVLPVVPGAHRALAYMDCSPLGAVT